MLIYSTPEYDYLMKNVVARLGLTEGKIEIKKFPDGEEYLRFLDEVGGKAVAVIGGVRSKDSLALYDMAAALSDLGASTVYVFIPYLSYSTMERRTKAGEAIKLKSRVMILDSLPKNCKIYTLDIHSKENTIDMFVNHKVENLTCFNQVATIIKENAPDSVIASPDQGRSQFIDYLGSVLKLNTAHIKKERIDGEKVELVSIEAEVEGKIVVIYDDMIRSGATLIQAARAYKKAGASKVYAVATHWVIGNEVCEKLESSGAFNRVFVSNSNPMALKLVFGGFMSVFDSGEVIANEINSIINREKNK